MYVTKRKRLSLPLHRCLVYLQALEMDSGGRGGPARWYMGRKGGNMMAGYETVCWLRAVLLSVPFEFAAADDAAPFAFMLLRRLILRSWRPGVVVAVGAAAGGPALATHDVATLPALGAPPAFVFP